MKSFVAALLVCGLSSVATAEVLPGAAGLPGPAAAGTVVAEYIAATGELIVSSGGAVNLFVDHLDSGISVLDPVPAPPAGILLTNNPSRVGLTGFGGISVEDWSFGSIGAEIPMEKLVLKYNSALGQPEVLIPAGATGFAYTVVPEPASVVLIGVGIVGLLAKRRRG